ncbi:MAG TPA: hypothetical protein VJN94_09460 [Candidatus Binataceae bacterium]|nr:hypothetical protein [Candidatus Binataceae bacterium]
MLHGFTPRLAYQVRDDSPRAFLNQIDKGASHLLIGRSDDGRYWTIAIRPTEEENVWKVITGYESNEREVSHYLKWLGRTARI